jgi:hypothetical protein
MIDPTLAPDARTGQETARIARHVARTRGRHALNAARCAPHR